MRETIILDVETSGLNDNENGLCSVAMKNPRSDDALYFTLKPLKNMKYEDEALRVNGFNHDDLMRYGLFESEGVQLIIDFVRANYKTRPLIIGYNVGFDIGFLKAMFKRNGYEFFDFFSYEKVCVLMMARFMHYIDLYKFENHKLTTVVKTLFPDMDLSEAHNSLFDVDITQKVYDEFVYKIKGDGIYERKGEKTIFN